MCQDIHKAEEYQGVRRGDALKWRIGVVGATGAKMLCLLLAKGDCIVHDP